MFILQQIITGEEQSFLPNSRCLLLGDQISFGRLPQCSIIFPVDDRSISRIHAVIELIKVDPQEKEPIFAVRLTDKSSVGTFINNVACQKGQTVILKENDVFKIGSLYSFTVKQEELAVAHTQLDASNRENLHKHVEMLGGRVISDVISSCTHLCTSRLAFTPKACQSMIYGITFVTPNYFEELILWAKKASKNERPKCSDFSPPIAEVQLKEIDFSLEPNPTRRDIFAQKSFYCFSETQKARFRHIIEWGGGTFECLSVDKHKNDATNLLKSDKAVLLKTLKSQFDSLTHGKQWVSELVLDWRRRGLREVAEKEIAFAILSASTVLYCNPRVSKEDLGVDQSMQSQCQDITSSQFVAAARSTWPTERLFSQSTSSPTAQSVAKAAVVRPSSPKRQKITQTAAECDPALLKPQGKAASNKTHITNSSTSNQMEVGNWADRSEKGQQKDVAQVAKSSLSRNISSAQSVGRAFPLFSNAQRGYLQKKSEKRDAFEAHFADSAARMEMESVVDSPRTKEIKRRIELSPIRSAPTEEVSDSNSNKHVDRRNVNANSKNDLRETPQEEASLDGWLERRRPVSTYFLSNENENHLKREVVSPVPTDSAKKDKSSEQSSQEARRNQLNISGWLGQRSFLNDSTEDGDLKQKCDEGVLFGEVAKWKYLPLRRKSPDIKVESRKNSNGVNFKKFQKANQGHTGIPKIIACSGQIRRKAE